MQVFSNTVAHKGHTANFKYTVAANFQNELLQIKTSKECARIDGRRSENQDLYILGGKLLLFFLGLCVPVRTDFLKCFPVRAVANALQPQISVINVVSNLIGQVSNKAAISVDNE